MCFPEDQPSFRYRELIQWSLFPARYGSHEPDTPVQPVSNHPFLRGNELVFPGFIELGEDIIVMNIHYWCAQCILTRIRQGNTWLHNHDGCRNNPEDDHVCMAFLHHSELCIPVEEVDMEVYGRLARHARLQWRISLVLESLHLEETG